MAYHDMSNTTGSPAPKRFVKTKAAHKVSATAAKGRDRSSTKAEQEASDREYQARVQARITADAVTAAQDTVTISPTLLAAMVTRSVAKGFEPVLAELRDIARTSHDTSDRLFGEELKAQAKKRREYVQASMQGPVGSSNSAALESQRLQGLMDKLWALGYRPTAEQPITCRSFHEFEALIGRR